MSGISLTPGFSPVIFSEERENRFNGFSHAEKPLKRLDRHVGCTTRLKPGVNEKNWNAPRFRQSQ
jgi:hypothetical protein